MRTSLTSLHVHLGFLISASDLMSFSATRLQHDTQCITEVGHGYKSLIEHMDRTQLLPLTSLNATDTTDSKAIHCFTFETMLLLPASTRFFLRLTYASFCPLVLRLFRFSPYSLTLMLNCMLATERTNARVRTFLGLSSACTPHPCMCFFAHTHIEFHHVTCCTGYLPQLGLFQTFLCCDSSPVNCRLRYHPILHQVPWCRRLRVRDWKRCRLEKLRRTSMEHGKSEDVEAGSFDRFNDPCIWRLSRTFFGGREEAAQSTVVVSQSSSCGNGRRKRWGGQPSKVSSPACMQHGDSSDHEADSSVIYTPSRLEMKTSSSKMQMLSDDDCSPTKIIAFTSSENDDTLQAASTVLKHSSIYGCSCF